MLVCRIATFTCYEPANRNTQMLGQSIDAVLRNQRKKLVKPDYQVLGVIG